MRTPGSLGDFDDAIALALQGRNKQGRLLTDPNNIVGAKLEGELGLALRDHIVRFQNDVRAPGPIQGNLTDIDLETPNFIFEVKAGRSGKGLENKISTLNDQFVNPTRKPVIVFAPEFTTVKRQQTLINFGAQKVINSFEQLNEFIKLNGGRL